MTKTGRNPSQAEKKKEKVYTEAEYNEAWRKGYDMGMKNALHVHSEAIKIGGMIIDVLDNRYEFKKEDE